MQTKIFLLFLSGCQKHSNGCHIISIVTVKDVHIWGLCSVVIISPQGEASPRYALLDFGYPSHYLNDYRNSH